MSTGTELTLPQRAAVALGSAEHEKQLVLLAEESKTITEIKNKDGRDQCHAAYMRLKNARVTINKIAEDARDDATKFSKAVIAEGKRLIGIIETEEERLQGLRDSWDAEIEAEKQRKIEAERQRVARHTENIDQIRELLTLAIDTKSEGIQEIISRLESMETNIREFQEFAGQAECVKEETLAKLRDMHAAAVAREEEAARIKAEQEAESRRLAEEADRLRKEQEAAAAKLAEERAELERQRKEQEDRDAAARREREEAEAKAKAELAEREHQLAEREAALRQQEEFSKPATIENPAVAYATPVEDLEEPTEPGFALVQPDAEEEFTPSAHQIIEAVAHDFAVSESKALEWLLSIDFNAAILPARQVA